MLGHTQRHEKYAIDRLASQEAYLRNDSKICCRSRFMQIYHLHFHAFNFLTLQVTF